MSMGTNSIIFSRWVIEDWIKRKIMKKETEFSLLEVSCETNTTLNLVFDHMLRMVRQKKLVLVWEIYCACCGAANFLAGKETIFCEKCGKKNLKVFPKFVAEPNYTTYVKSLSEKGA